MKQIQDMSVLDITEILLIKKRIGYIFLCPHCQENLQIFNNGEFFCCCGLEGKDWIELTSMLYNIDQFHAENWLKNHIKLPKHNRK
jgi:hypothetical protein